MMKCFVSIQPHFTRSAPMTLSDRSRYLFAFLPAGEKGNGGGLNHG
ncbi:hypothetical protein FHT29_000848 [Rhizobium sp. SG741]|nr:hypothetical protein [Rhizobium sp. SG741]